MIKILQAVIIFICSTDASYQLCSVDAIEITLPVVDKAVAANRTTLAYSVVLQLDTRLFPSGGVDYRELTVAREVPLFTYILSVTPQLQSVGHYVKLETCPDSKGQ